MCSSGQSKIFIAIADNYENCQLSIYGPIFRPYCDVAAVNLILTMRVKNIFS